MASDVKSMSLDPQVESNVYVPYWQWPMQTPTLFVRTAGNPADFAAALYSEVKALNKNLPTPKVQTMNERLADVVAEPRFQTLLLGLFGLMALVIIGLAGALALTHLMKTLLFGVSANDPLTFCTIALLLALVALLACWVPGRRATRVNPIVALRQE